VSFDFTGAPPAQGGGSTDHVAPGRYPIRLAEIVDGTSRSGKRMVTASFEVVGGAEDGKRLKDNFVLQSDQKFGLQRLHAFLLALKLGVSEKAVRVDLDKLVGRVCIGQATDDEIPANDNYPARLTSRLVAYYAPEAPASAAKAPAPVAAPAAAVAAPAPAAVQADVPAPTEVVDLAQEVDDLFD